MNVAKRAVSSGTAPVGAEEGVPAITIGVSDATVVDIETADDGDEVPLARTISSAVRAEMLVGPRLSDDQKSRLQRLDVERRDSRGEDTDQREAWLHATSSREAFAKAQAQRDALRALSVSPRSGGGEEEWEMVPGPQTRTSCTSSNCVARY